MKKVRLLFIAFLIFGYMGLHFLAGIWVNSFYNEERYAQMKTFFYQPVIVPNEYFQDKDIPLDLLDTGKEIDKIIHEENLTVIDHNVLKKLRDGTDLSGSEWGQVNSELQRIKPLLVRLISFSQMPGYSLGAWPKDTETGVFRFQTLESGARALLLRAHASARNADWEDAFDSVLAVYRLATRRPASNLLVHGTAIAMQGNASNVAMALVEQCGDVTVLQRSLHELNRLDLKINLNVLKQAQCLDIISSLREYKRKDPSIDLTPGMKGRHYFRQLMNYGLKNNEQKKRWPEQLPPLWVVKTGRLLGFGRQMDEILNSVFTPDLSSLHTREMIALTEFRLTQISLAARLKLLETGEAATSTSGLVLKYLNKKCVDPFAETVSNADFKFDNQRSVFYGIGPDKKDDLNSIQYDRSNGTVSSGDISMPY